MSMHQFVKLFCLNYQAYSPTLLVGKLSKLQKGEGTDTQQEEWIECMKNSFPFYEKIINLLFWSNEELSPDEIFQRAKQEHSPIIL